LTGLVKEHLQPADRSAEPVAATRLRARNEDETGQRALQTGDELGSEREYQLCADDFASIVARGQATPDDLAQQNHCLVGLADNLAHAGRLAAAERRYREAATAVGPSAGFELSISSSTAWSKLADVELDLGMAADAAQAATSSGDRAKPWAADNQPLEQQKRARKRVAVSYLYSGHSARVAGEPDAARRWFSSALLIDQGLAAAPRAPARAKSDLAEDLYGLALADLDQGHLTEAVAHLDEASADMASLLELDHDKVEWQLYAEKIAAAKGRNRPRTDVLSERSGS
jgi:tetratricopeptide (TPR) repeat protein